MAIMDGEVEAATDKKPEMETGKIIGVFEAAFIGMVPVKAFKGEEVVNRAIDEVMRLKTSEGCFLQVGLGGQRKNVVSFSPFSLSHLLLRRRWALRASALSSRSPTKC